VGFISGFFSKKVESEAPEFKRDGGSERGHQTPPLVFTGAAGLGQSALALVGRDQNGGTVGQVADRSG
jgi:hypothetical protein